MYVGREDKNPYRNLVGKPGWKRPCGRPRRRWNYNIYMDLHRLRLEGVGWIHLTQYKERALRTIINVF
jgi:hypothetical protein